MKSFLNKDWVKLLPFLFLYIVISLLRQNNYIYNDEERYWKYAGNLINGTYAFKTHVFLWNGPGYPLFLVPFKFFGIPLFVPKLFNALFLYASLIFFCKSLVLYVSSKRALIFTILFGLYYPMLMQSLHRLLTEAISIFCITAFVYFLFIGLKKNIKSSLIISSFFLAYLALVKVIFGYVILVLLILVSIYMVISKFQNDIKNYLFVLACSLILCSPYLFYTYSLTGKYFYWGNSGSMSLYWMSSPYENELGDWHVFSLKENEQLKENHGKYLKSIRTLTPIEKDNNLKKKALENIINNKRKFISNWISNVSRYFFSYPLSFLKPSNGILFYLIPNMFILVFILIALILSIFKRKKTPRELLFIALMFFIYSFGISLLSSYARFLFPVIPLILIWIFVVISNNIKIVK